MLRTARSIAGLFLLTIGLANTATAQPYDFFADTFSNAECDLINASNVELVLFSSTDELVLVSGTDVFLGTSFVDQDANVFFEGEPAGFVGFADDGDGFRSVFWMTEFGTVVEFDLDLFLPFDSGIFPDEFVGVPCDACPFWDIPEDCEDIFFDSDDDGVSDEDDLCPSTFPGEIVDFDGCSCEDLGDCDCFFDSDLDDVADCDDFCPDTPPGPEVDFDGCACFEVDDDGDGIDNCDDLCPNSSSNDDVDLEGCAIVTPIPVVVGCGSFGALMLGLTFTGLFMMRFTGGAAYRAAQGEHDDAPSLFI